MERPPRKLVDPEAALRILRQIPPLNGIQSTETATESVREPDDQPPIGGKVEDQEDSDGQTYTPEDAAA
jgi:hypothetical protein